MHSQSVVSHLVSVRSSAGNSAQVGARLSALLAPARKAAGCIYFVLQQSLIEDDVWMISGSWADRSAMNDWFSNPELQVFADLVTERLVSSLDFQTFATISAAQAEASAQMGGMRKAG